MGMQNKLCNYPSTLPQSATLLKSLCLLSVHHHECAQSMYGVTAEESEMEGERRKKTKTQIKRGMKKTG